MNSKKIIVAVSLIVFAAGTMQAERYKYENARKGNDAPPGTAANCTPATAATELNINNVKALIQSGGDMWWDFNRSRYEIPQGSEKTSLFAGSLWLAVKTFLVNLKWLLLDFVKLEMTIGLGH